MSSKTLPQVQRDKYRFLEDFKEAHSRGFGSAHIVANSYKVQSIESQYLSWPHIQPDLPSRETMPPWPDVETEDAFWRRVDRVGRAIDPTAKSNSSLASDLAKLSASPWELEGTEPYLQFARKWGLMGFTNLYRHLHNLGVETPSWVQSRYGRHPPLPPNDYDPVDWLAAHADTISFLLRLIQAWHEYEKRVSSLYSEDLDRRVQAERERQEFWEGEGGGLALDKVLYQRELYQAARDPTERRFLAGTEVGASFSGRENEAQVPTKEREFVYARRLDRESVLVFRPETPVGDIAIGVIHQIINSNLEGMSPRLLPASRLRERKKLPYADVGFLLVAPIQACYLHLMNMASGAAGIHLKKCDQCGSLFITPHDKRDYCPSPTMSKESPCAAKKRLKRHRDPKRLHSRTGAALEECKQALRDSDDDFDLAVALLEQRINGGNNGA